MVWSLETLYILFGKWHARKRPPARPDGDGPCYTIYFEYDIDVHMRYLEYMYVYMCRSISMKNYTRNLKPWGRGGVDPLTPRKGRRTCRAVDLYS